MIRAGKTAASPQRDTGFEAHFPDASREYERARLGETLEDAEACSGLWLAVVELAVRDLAALRRLQRAGARERHVAARLREIQEGDPLGFFTSDKFKLICDMIGAPADVIRGRCGVDELPHKCPAA